MKKIISTVVAFALAGVMAVSAFAAGAGFNKDQLKKIAADSMTMAENNGISISLSEVNAAIDALTAPEEVDVNALKVIAKNAKDAIRKADSQSEINKIVTDALDQMKGAMGSNTVEVGQFYVELTVDGIAKISGNATVCGTPVSAQADTKAVAPEWTDDSNKGENGGSANTTAPAGSAGSATAGVIKPTGMNTTGAAVVALSVVAVLGVAAVKARKLGE